MESNVSREEMPKGMTFLTIRHKGEYRLGVKTDKGVLDVRAASRLFGKKVPTTIDDVIRGGDRGLTALVRAALNSDKAKSVFLDESEIEFGPCVTNPEKILTLASTIASTPWRPIRRSPPRRCCSPSATMRSTAITA